MTACCSSQPGSQQTTYTASPKWNLSFPFQALKLLYSLWQYLLIISFLLKKLIYYFNWRLITLQYCGVFCHTLTWISLEPPSHLPPHPIPLGCPSTPALSALFHAPNLDWWSISHMVIYMFQCYPLKSSHPRLLQQNPKVYSLSLCLFCCLAYRVMVTIFLNSIYLC